jgi:hypothetical protein
LSIARLVRSAEGIAKQARVAGWQNTKEESMSSHRMKMGIATLAIAGVGVVAPLAAVGSADAAAPAAVQNGLVNVVAKHILNHNRVVILKNVPISTAAAVCDVNVNLLSRELTNQHQAYCPALSHNSVITKVFPA